MSEKRAKRIPAWRRALRESGMTFGLGFLLVLLATWFTFQFIEPAPPRQLTIASGSADGAYRQFGYLLREQLAEHDVVLDVIETDGSVDNLQRLKEGAADVAFVQSGLAMPVDYPSFETLGALYFEPIWVFSRADSTLTRLSELKNKQVASGGAGSGTRSVALRLLADNGLTEADITLTKQGGMQAVNALRTGEVDAIISVSSINAPMITALLNDPGLSLVSITRAPAYARREPWLTHLTLPEGVLDLARNYPDRSIDLLAVNATLVGTKALHPALRDLLLLAIDQIFSDSTLLSAAEQFPSSIGSDFPLSEQAARYHEHGPPLLQRYLPFWIANLVDRLKLLALPLLALLLPLSRVMPPIYRWTVRKKIYRWYDEVQELDQLASEDGTPRHLEHCLSELVRIENDVRQIQVPLGYAHELYGLRQHIELLMRQLEQRLNIPGDAT